MSGIRNEVLFGDNVDFSGAAIATPQVVADGQLLIGSTASPNIRVATLTSSDSSVTITNGAGTIDLSVVPQAGTSFPLQIVNGATPFVPDAVTSCYLSVDTSGTAYTIQLPDAPATGKFYVIKDSGGNSSMKNITVTTVSGAVLFENGAGTSITINQDYAAYWFIFNGAQWEIF